MRKALLLLCLLAAPAWAGERLLGTLVSAAGADVSNGSTAAPFFVPFGAKLTVQCNATAYFVTDTATAASSTTAIKLSADEKFPTSTGSSGNAATVVVSSKPSAVVRVAGPAAVTCLVWQRAGNE